MQVSSIFFIENLSPILLPPMSLLQVKLLLWVYTVRKTRLRPGIRDESVNIGVAWKARIREVESTYLPTYLPSLLKQASINPTTQVCNVLRSPELYWYQVSLVILPHCGHTGPTESEAGGGRRRCKAPRFAEKEGWL